jgi:hypothetical protein
MKGKEIMRLFLFTYSETSLVALLPTEGLYRGVRVGGAGYSTLENCLLYASEVHSSKVITNFLCVTSAARFCKF